MCETSNARTLETDSYYVQLLIIEKYDYSNNILKYSTVLVVFLFCLLFNPHGNQGTEDHYLLKLSIIFIFKK